MTNKFSIFHRFLFYISRYIKRRIKVIEYDRIANICEEFRHERYIDVSQQSKILIKDILDAIILDPHPRWKFTKKKRKHVANYFASELYVNLFNIAKEEQVEKIITSFDILHWLSRHIDKLCPFTK